MRHLHASSLKAALDIEAFVGITAVKNSLVAADLVRDKVEGIDQSKTQFLALLVLCDCNVFDVADRTEVVDAKKSGHFLLARKTID